MRHSPHSSRYKSGDFSLPGDPYFDGEGDRLVALAARYSVPAIYQWREFTKIGGLRSYGTSIHDAYLQAGTYTRKILSGAKRSELLVLRPTRIEMVINLKTAAALGLALRNDLLAGADAIIE
jgi:putative tryptophan/tyrosine transport system substrate-binding protein